MQAELHIIHNASIHVETSLEGKTHWWHFIQEGLLDQENCSSYHVSEFLFGGVGW